MDMVDKSSNSDASNVQTRSCNAALGGERNILFLETSFNVCAMPSINTFIQ